MKKHQLALLGLWLVSACSSVNISPAAKSQQFRSDVKQVIIPDAMASSYEQFQFAPAVRVGDMIYLSGVVARLNESETAGNITPAINRVFDEIELILAEAGADWGDVVDVTSYMTDLDAQIGPLWAVKGERVKAPYPAWSAIGVNRLYGGDAALIEIKVVAYKPEG